MTVASQSTQENTLIFTIPMIDSKDDKLLIDSPSVGQSGHKGTVNHIPQLTVILSLLLQNRKQNRTGFTYGVGTKLRKNIRFTHTFTITNLLDLRHNFFGHILIIIFKTQRIFDRKSATDI